MMWNEKKKKCRLDWKKYKRNIKRVDENESKFKPWNKMKSWNEKHTWKGEGVVGKDQKM